MREKVRVRVSHERNDGALWNSQRTLHTVERNCGSRPTPHPWPYQRSFHGHRSDLRQNSRYFQNSKFHGHPQQHSKQPHFHDHRTRATVPSENPRNNSTTVHGHRGFARLPWRWVPREPPLVEETESLTTVFVDGIQGNMAKEWLGDLFSEFGRVMDVYISSKTRRHRRDAFGFVRYGKKTEALTAIKKFDGFLVKGRMMKVSLARYNKNGKAYEERKKNVSKNVTHNRGIKFPAWRDGRSYSEVVTEKQSRLQRLGEGRDQEQSML
ncbi:unnamed protein product [Amaranthus hypochondriacus]